MTSFGITEPRTIVPVSQRRTLPAWRASRRTRRVPRRPGPSREGVAVGDVEVAQFLIKAVRRHLAEPASGLRAHHRSEDATEVDRGRRSAATSVGPALGLRPQFHVQGLYRNERASAPASIWGGHSLSL